jgi:uncharacterized protein YjbI with pentapeptide repeats
VQRRNAWIVATSVASVAALVILLLACILVFPRLLYPPLSAADLAGVASADRRVELRQAQSELQSNTRELLLQGIGGLLLIAGVVATWRQVQVSREGQITERFTRAMEHLGSETADVRLGGIYALERIARNSEMDRATITEILVAFVRGHASWPAGSPVSPEPHPTPAVDRQLRWLRDRAPDVQAAMLVLGRRPRSRDEERVDLGTVDLRRSRLTRARMSGVRMRHANLADAWMREIYLEHGDLEDTDLRLTNLSEGHLTGAVLRHAYLDDANVRGAHLGGADLTATRLCRADLRDADLRRARLHHADLRGADLRGAQLDHAELAGVLADATTRWPDGFDAGSLAGPDEAAEAGQAAESIGATEPP